MLACRVSKIEDEEHFNTDGTKEDLVSTPKALLQGHGGFLE